MSAHPDGLNSMRIDKAINSASALDDSTAPITVKPSNSTPLDTRRPTTRSQTGTIAKRRARDDDHVLDPRKRAPPVRKRHKITSNFSATVSLDSGSSHADESASSKPPSTREVSLCSASSTPVLPSSQKAPLTFYHSSMSETDQPQNHLPRSRASLPTPIPNLTKKSRGRRVPTKDTPDTDPNQRDSRLYVCTVEECGKCFHRGEHLKRHIRSIHTHEKPFKCTFPLCEKYFNRHDNLLQHLKVHRETNSISDQPSPVAKQDESQNALTSSAPRNRRHVRRQNSFSEEEDDESMTPSRPRTIYDAYPSRYSSYSASSTSSIPQMIYGHFNQNTGSEKAGNGVATQGDRSNEAMTILTNVAVSSLRMEVSSLRTELPRSPVEVVGAM